LNPFVSEVTGPLHLFLRLETCQRPKRVVKKANFSANPKPSR
jgi:hypothetical protein